MASKCVLVLAATLAFQGGMPAFAASQGSAFATVTVRNVAPGKGPVYVSICRKEQFLTDQCISRHKTDATQAEVVIKAGPVPAGRYAIQVWQDANADTNFNTNAFGAPTEPTGYSRGARGNMGPPKFEDAEINLSDRETNVTVDLF